MDTLTESSRDNETAIPILRAWTDDASLRHGFIGRAGGVSTGAFASMNLSHWVGDDERAVDSNWARLRREIPALDLVARLNQVHGNDVHAATRDTAGLRPAGDGLVTAEPGVILGIFTADCVPILMVDTKRKIAGALHAGWRGVIADIAAAGVRAMLQLGRPRLRHSCRDGPVDRSVLFRSRRRSRRPFQPRDRRRGQPY